MCVCNDISLALDGGNTSSWYYTGSNCTTAFNGTRNLPVLNFTGEIINATVSNATYQPWVGVAPGKQYSYFQFDVPSVQFPLTLTVTPGAPSQAGSLVLVAAYANQYARPSESQVRDVPVFWRSSVYKA